MSYSHQPLLSAISRSRKWALLAHHLPPTARVLEVGTGDGWFARRLREAGHHVTTVDLQPPADVVGDIQNWRQLPLPAGHFDAVVALEVIEHVDCVEALQALCQPGGLIFLSSPHPRWDWVMQALEALGLTQRRTSPHINLVNFHQLPWEPIVRRRPLGIHQVGLFRNNPVHLQG